MIRENVKACQMTWKRGEKVQKEVSRNIDQTIVESGKIIPWP